MEYKFKLFGRKYSVDCFWASFNNHFHILPTIVYSYYKEGTDAFPKVVLSFRWLYILSDLNIFGTKHVKTFSERYGYEQPTLSYRIKSDVREIPSCRFD